jgi:hypothetical protein
LTVAEPGEVAVQVVAADSAGRVLVERFDVAPTARRPCRWRRSTIAVGERIHVIYSGPGRLSVAYRAEIETRPGPPMR